MEEWLTGRLQSLYKETVETLTGGVETVIGNVGNAAQSNRVWYIRISDDGTLGPLSLHQVMKGLREGWITLEDSASRDKNAWLQIKWSLGEDLFGVRAFVNPPKVFASLYARFAILISSLIVLFGLLVYYGVTLAHESAVIMSIVCILLPILILTGAFIGFLKFSWRGAICAGLLMVIGLGVATGAVLLDRLAEASNDIVEITPSGKTLAILFILATSAVIIAGSLAYVVGWIVGKSRSNRYQLSPTRQSAPEWVTETEREPLTKPDNLGWQMLAGTVVLAMLALGFFGVRFGIRRMMMTSQLKSFNLNEYKSIVAKFPINADSSNPSSLSSAYTRPKIIAINRATGEVDDIYYDLPDELRATRPEEVGTILALQCGTEFVVEYTKGAKGYAHKCTVQIIDRSMPTLVDTTGFTNYPPTTISGYSWVAYGDKPNNQVLAYIKNLPRK